MHARIDQLLSLRDGEPVEADIVRHIEACPSCTVELGRLRRMQHQMRSLAAMDPPADALGQIQARIQTVSPPARGRFALAIAAALVVVIVSGLLARRSDTANDERVAITTAPPVTSVQSEPPPALEHLVAQSRELDEVLQHLPGRPAVERVAMAATIDSIEERVQWLDQQLSYGPDTGLNDAQTYQLWRERVDLMDSLVKVRYAEGGRTSF